MGIFTFACWLSSIITSFIFGSVERYIIGIVKKAIEKIKELLNYIFTKLKEIFEWVLGKFTDIMKDAFNSLVNLIKDAFKKLKNEVKGVTKKVFFTNYIYEDDDQTITTKNIEKRTEYIIEIANKDADETVKEADRQIENLKIHIETFKL